MVIFYIIAVVVGLMVGSFLNVCIYRIPLEGASIFRPRRSFCPECKKSIATYDNIPVLSYLLLRGRCRYCGNPIGAVYPLVELLTGLGALWLVWQYGLTSTTLALFFYLCLLITLSGIDLQLYLIPNKIILTGITIAPLIALVEVLAFGRPPLSLLYGPIGLLMGGLLLLGVAMLGELIFRKEAMGGGDIKLVAMIGMFFAWWPDPPTSMFPALLFIGRQLLLVLILGAFVGAIAGAGILVARARGSEERIIPFGPFLAAGSLVAMQFGDALWKWYMGFLQ